MSLQNLLFINDYFNGLLPDCFDGYFTLLSDSHSPLTGKATNGHLVVPRVDSDCFGRKSFKDQSTVLWNDIAAKFPQENFANMP